jgi:hypothetical protein
MFPPRVVVLLLISFACFATSIVRISLEETISKAEWIVEGDVVRNWCDWDSGHRFIWTHTEIAIRGQWKGSLGSSVTISEPGGTVAGMNLDVAGMVRYAPGEHVVVFLYRTPIGYLRTVGLAQGKLQVDRTGRVHPVRPDAMVVHAAGTPSTGSSIAEFDSLSLSSVRERVNRIAAAAKEVRK